MTQATTDSPEVVARLRHDLSWHYDEVAYLRSAIEKALNSLIRPESQQWPGDEPPVVEAIHTLQEALRPSRRHQ